METQIVYAFGSGQIATRFLNQLKSGSVSGVRARLYRGSKTVLVSYTPEPQAGFDDTCSQLDELAATLEGVEVTL